KHLMTIKGGSSSDQNYEMGLRNRVGGENKLKYGDRSFSTTIRGKLHKIHSKRTSSLAWEQGQKFGGYNQERANRMAGIHVDAQAHYQAQALGGIGMGQDTNLTIVLCDLVEFEELKGCFASAIARLRKSNPGGSGSGTVHPHVRINFP